MDEEEGGGIRLSKRFSDKGGEVDYKTKAGTAWSHSYLNQKPWHPLSYPNQRRKWIAEQTYAQKELRAEEVAREYAQEQEFFRQTALVSKKEKEKMEMMKAVSFMYVRPPGYNAESAKAAEVAEEKRKQEQEQDQNSESHGPSTDGATSSMKMESLPSGEEKKKPRPKDVFGRALPTDEQFEVLKNAPRLETGLPARSKPFGVEIRNVKCLRCGNFGHQSGDRECPLKDAIMPNEESRLKRDDPLTAILAQTETSEPLKWELKQKPGLSPPRGGFKADDPNQQIVAEDIFDEYGGFLSGDNLPELLTSFPSSKPKKKKSSKRKQKRHLSPTDIELNDHGNRPSYGDERERRLKKKRNRTSVKPLESSSSEHSWYDYRNHGSCGSESGRRLKKEKLKMSRKHSESSTPKHADLRYDHRSHWSSSDDERRRRLTKRRHKTSRKHSKSSSPKHLDSDLPYHQNQGPSSSDIGRRRSSKKETHARKPNKFCESSSSEDSDYDGHRKSKSRHRHYHMASSESSEPDVSHKGKHRHRRHH